MFFKSYKIQAVERKLGGIIALSLVLFRKHFYNWVGMGQVENWAECGKFPFSQGLTHIQFDKNTLIHSLSDQTYPYPIEKKTQRKFK